MWVLMASMIIDYMYELSGISHIVIYYLLPLTVSFKSVLPTYVGTIEGLEGMTLSVVFCG